VHSICSHGHQTPSPDMSPARMPQSVGGSVGGEANRGVDLLTLCTLHFVGLKTTTKRVLHSGHLLHKAPHRDWNLFHLFILRVSTYINPFLSDVRGNRRVY